MFFSSQSIALFISSFITISVFIVEWFLGYNDTSRNYIVYPFLFGITFILVYSTLEYLIFNEINKIYEVFDKIKQKDEAEINLKNFKTRNLPVKRKKIYQEVYTYVSKKQEEIKELKKIELFRREFLADISHELKTPIFAAQGYIHTLLDGAMGDKEVREKFLKKAAKSLDGLQEMVEELLTLSQLETGELKMNMADFNIHELTLEVFDMLELKAKKKEIKLKFADNSDRPVWVKAINYGNEDGKVVVGFDLDKDNVIVSVKDNGPGIPPEHLKRVFERFYRIEKSRSKEKGGTGLGLAIVQEIIEAHKSKVMVTSKVGKGTTFAFILKKAIGDGKVQGPN